MIKRWEKWIQAIVDDTNITPQEIVTHMQKHCDAELRIAFSNWTGCDETLLEEWVASMENLIAILVGKTGIGYPSHVIHIERLQLHRDNNPDKSTPEPE